jgi:lipoate-protein ligase A
VLRCGPGHPAWNLACDEALLRSGDVRPVLRLYAWDPPALSLGYFQPAEPFVSLARQAGALLVRRPTGGGAIHHDREFTFCLVATPGRDGYPLDIVTAYEQVHRSLQHALDGLGARLHFRGEGAPLSVSPRAASLCFEDTTSMDLLDEVGRKVVGSAQRRSVGRVLHHGSIPLQVPSLTPEAGSLERAAGRVISWEEVADAVQTSLEQRIFGAAATPDTLSHEERQSAEQLARERYSHTTGQLP